MSATEVVHYEDLDLIHAAESDVVDGIPVSFCVGKLLWLTEADDEQTGVMIGSVDTKSGKPPAMHRKTWFNLVGMYTGLVLKEVWDIDIYTTDELARKTELHNLKKRKIEAKIKANRLKLDNPTWKPKKPEIGTRRGEVIDWKKELRPIFPGSYGVPDNEYSPMTVRNLVRYWESEEFSNRDRLIWEEDIVEAKRVIDVIAEHENVRGLLSGNEQ